MSQPQPVPPIGLYTVRRRLPKVQARVLRRLIAESRRLSTRRKVLLLGMLDHELMLLDAIACCMPDATAAEVLAKLPERCAASYDRVKAYRVFLNRRRIYRGGGDQRLVADEEQRSERAAVYVMQAPPPRILAQLNELPPARRAEALADWRRAQMEG